MPDEFMLPSGDEEDDEETPINKRLNEVTDHSLYACCEMLAEYASRDRPIIILLCMGRRAQQRFVHME